MAEPHLRSLDCKGPARRVLFPSDRWEPHCCWRAAGWEWQDLTDFSGCCVEKGLLPGESGSLETPIRSKL